MATKVYRATVFEVPERQTLHIVKDALIEVAADTGLILQVLDPSKDSDAYQVLEANATKTGTLTAFSPNQFVLPGLIDLHVHAPQWPQLGKALDRPLEKWLQECTFPLEAKHGDPVFADKSYRSLVSTLLANGTTTVAYFASVHLDTSVLLAKICVEKGQRAVVGKVAMDLPDQCPEYYRDASPQAAVDDTEHFIEQVRALPNNEAGLVLPAVIPRFIPSCSHEALQGLGQLVKKYGVHVQTHCSESDWEHNHVLDRYKMHDAFALDSFGLLTRRTVLAHSNFLDDADMQLVKERQCAVAHCPLSNYFFSNAVFPLRKALNLGLHVGMGTDISGGPSASLFEVCRHSIAASRAFEDGVDATLPAAERHQKEPTRIDHLDAFYVSTTLGGVGLEMNIGRIAPGYYFDAVVIDTSVPTSNICIFEEVDSLTDIFEKIIYNVAQANVVQTYVAGRCVHDRLN